MKKLLLVSTAAMFALAVGSHVTPAQADDCLLDTNNDGNADDNVDTDLNANSSGTDALLACGSNASAGGSNSTAIGANSTASGDFSAAL
jgi:hypothetical protein